MDEAESMAEREDQWARAWVELECGGQGERRARICAWSAKDRRTPSTPKLFDHAWKVVEAYVVGWALAPLAILALRAPWWQSLGFCIVFYAMAFMGWRSSKTSWRARWAGPQECAVAKSRASGCAHAARWLAQALERGVLCADAEMIEWMHAREMDVARRLYARQREEAAKLAAKDAFDDMNRARLDALREREELDGDAIAPPAAPRKTSRL